MALVLLKKLLRKKPSNPLIAGEVSIFDRSGGLLGTIDMWNLGDTAAESTQVDGGEDVLGVVVMSCRTLRVNFSC